MITIALDEGGQFEQSTLENFHKCMFIGGLVFSYKNKKDCVTELERIQHYLQNTCNSNGYKYPEDLHYNRINGSVINGDKARVIKKSLISTISDFINGKGEWLNNPPKGTYFLYALVGDKNSSPKIFSGDNVSNLINDNKVCNRYEHMAYRVIENLLFYNPKLNDDNITLDLATRTIPTEDENFARELKEAGYENDNGFFKVTHPGTFRSSIATSIQNSNKTNLHFDMKVQSIYYKESSSNLYQGFLYLADTICSLYEDLLKGCNNAESAINTLWLKGKEYVKPDNLFLWTYNDFDQEYRNLYNVFKAKDLYKTLKYDYLLSKKNQKNYIVYKETWLSEIESKILKADKSYSFALNRSIQQLESDVSNYCISVAEARFIYNFLKPLTIELCKYDENILFNLYKTELAINNHEGNYLKAKLSFEECMKYSKYINMEDCFELRNRFSVSLCDEGKYKEAINFTMETLDWARFVKEAKENIYGGGTLYTYLGRVESQLGQCFSFNKDFDSAIFHFEKALTEFNDIGNIKITQSYMLHTYIEAKNEEKYKDLSVNYFGSNNLIEQLLSIIKNLNIDSIAYSFSLYVYLKAFYVFYANKVKKQELEKIIHYLEPLKTFDTSNVHPWEMIYKYIALLCGIVGNNEYKTKGTFFLEKAKDCLDNKDGILTRIINEMDSQYDAVLNKSDAFEKSGLIYMYR